jgi:hypothetical protein
VVVVVVVVVVLVVVLIVVVGVVLVVVLVVVVVVVVAKQFSIFVKHSAVKLMIILQEGSSIMKIFVICVRN